MESVSSTWRLSRSTTVWNASAPATRVTGSKSTFRMWPLRASSRSSFSWSSWSGVISFTSYEYGLATPSFRRALPCSSNSIGRFLKHMRLGLLGVGAFEFLRVRRLVAGERLLQLLVLEDVHAARLWLLAVALGLVDGAAVLELLVEEAHDLRRRRRVALLAGERRRDLPSAVPDRLEVVGPHAHPPHPPDARAVRPRDAPGQRRPRRRLVERRELVGEARHRAADAGPAGDHAAAHVVDRAALGDVALHDRPPAPHVDEALAVTVLLGELALLVVAGAGAMAVDGLVELPLGPAQLVELGQRAEALEEHQDAHDDLGEVVADRRAARHVHHRDPER